MIPRSNEDLTDRPHIKYHTLDRLLSFSFHAKEYYFKLRRIHILQFKVICTFLSLSLTDIIYCSPLKRFVCLLFSTVCLKSLILFPPLSHNIFTNYFYIFQSPIVAFLPTLGAAAAYSLVQSRPTHNMYYLTSIGFIQYPKCTFSQGTCWKCSLCYILIQYS